MKRKRKYEESWDLIEFLKIFNLYDEKKPTDQEKERWFNLFLKYYGTLIFLLLIYIFGSAPLKCWLYGINQRGEPFLIFHEQETLILLILSLTIISTIPLAIFNYIKCRFFVSCFIISIVLISNLYFILGSFTCISNTGVHYRKLFHCNTVHHSWNEVTKVTIDEVYQIRGGNYLSYNFYFTKDEILSLDWRNSEKFMKWVMRKKVPIEAESESVYLYYEEARKYLKIPAKKN